MFTKKKFLSLSIPSQHKKIAERLKVPGSLVEIRELEEWMGIKEPLQESSEALMDRYHYHLRSAGISLKEHNLFVTKEDRKEPLGEWLQANIYLDSLRSAHNVGSILRTCEAFRLGKIYFSESTPGLDHPSVQKTSMGTHLYIEKTERLSLEKLPRPIIVLETHRSAIPLEEFIFPEKFTLVLGNEEYGVSEKSLSLADYIVEIPLFGCKNSLNVAACFAVVAARISGSIRKNLGRR